MSRSIILLGYICLLCCSQTVAQTPAGNRPWIELRAARTTPAGGYPLVKSVNGTRFYVADSALVSDDDIASATVDTGASNGVVLEVRLEPRAAARFTEFTQHHVGEYLAVLFNGELRGTPPRIMDPITTPMLTLTGLPLADAQRFAAAVAAQSSANREPPNAVMIQFVRFADIFGSRLVAAFDSIPAARYDYRPTPSQQTVGYVAQHLESANYGLCERLGDAKHPRTAKDSLADSVKSRWPKDTLVARLEASLRFCDTVLERMGELQSPTHASTLLAFETDLAEHYSQIAVYMRLLGLVPPSALPPRPRTAITLPASALSPLVGVYEAAPGLELVVTMQDGALSIRSTPGGSLVRLWPESAADFFVREVDAQVTFTRDSGGAVTGLVLHQYGRDRPARKTR
jgi:hypothetical protein